MTDLELRASLEKLLDGWLDKRAEECCFEWVYHDQAADMAEAAWRVLKGSRDGQRYKAQE